MKQLISLIVLLFIANTLMAQVVKVGGTDTSKVIQAIYLETYYISDEFDGRDSINGRIFETGSKTYRIYVQIKQGYKLKSIYGDVNHNLRFTSTNTFFNNVDDRAGVYFGYQINNTWFKSNPTVALDSWLTIGQATIKHKGILKSEDKDGSLLGTTKTGGLLNDTNAIAGIPISVEDGMQPKSGQLINIVDKGFRDSDFPGTGTDTTIFGAKIGNEFNSSGREVLLSGDSIVGSNDNKILIAQLTTAGDITFELNLEVMDKNFKSFKYVAKNGGDSLNTSIYYSRFLTYPPIPEVCGCKDPHFIEYNPSSDCSDSTKCKNVIVFGCMDPLGCNYNPKANVSVLCCYPGHCQDRDLSIVCPHLINEITNKSLYPSPANESINLVISSAELLNTVKDANYSIFNYYGKEVAQKQIIITEGAIKENIDISSFENGFYVLRLNLGSTTVSKSFMKQ